MYAFRSPFLNALLTAAIGTVLLALAPTLAAGQSCIDPSDFNGGAGSASGIIWRTGTGAPAPVFTQVMGRGDDGDQIMHRRDANGSAVWTSCKVQDPSDGTFVFLPASTSADSIPVKGAGGRMMWYASRAAFRAGKVDGEDRDQGDGTAQSWNAKYVGFYSAAFGENTRAGGKWSAAFGENTVAATDHSMSIGHCNSANSANADSRTGDGDGTLFVVGNGTGDFTCQTTSDALVLDESGNLTISGSLTQSSDRRLKTEIRPLSDGVLQKLAALRPVRYQFKNQDTHPSGEQIGLVAQDVRKEFPALVGSNAKGHLTLAYPKLTAVLLKGLQEQQRRIEKQRRRIEKKNEQLARLKANQQTIRERLARLEAQADASPTTAGWTGAPTAWGLAILLAGGVLGFLVRARVRLRTSE